MGSAITLWESKQLIEIASGPVRTGKTRAWLEKAHYACTAFPGTRVLFARQTKHSLAQTILQTFEDDVLPPGYTKNYSGSREYRQAYEYLNGSMIVLTGLDDLTKLLSGEYDMILIFQAEECLQETVLGLTTRLSGKHLPFVQLGMDCNPRGQSHWIKKMIEENEAHCIDFRFQDNPRWYDPDSLQWTEAGKEYIGNLMRTLKGHQRDRMLYGRWVNPEGARFKDLSRSVQGFTFKERFPNGFPEHYRRWMGGDWGRSDPFACVWHASDENGTIYTYLEAYETGMGTTEQAEKIVGLCPSNDLKYDAMMIDGSMWSGEKSFGGDPEKGPAAVQWQKVFDEKNAELGWDKFPSLRKGPKNMNEQGYVTLEGLLKENKWFIELGCVNLWAELEDAVYYKNPRTGIADDLINPGNSKYCADHLLEACVYSLHQRSPQTHDLAPPIEVQIQQANLGRMEKLRDNADKRHREKTSRYRT